MTLCLNTRARIDKHVDWINLIKTDDNYKNILQVKIQKEFKITPDYLEISNHSVEHGYRMGVYICLGQPIHMVATNDSVNIKTFGSFHAIHNHMSSHGKIFVFLGEGIHKIKKKAEQLACEDALCNIINF